MWNDRSETDPDGKWPYLRNNNFGAGSIRRYISVGSVFKGSPWANSIGPIVALGDANEPPTFAHTLLIAALEIGIIPNDVAAMLQDSNGSYLEPTCAADLAVGSTAMLELESANYPDGHKKTRWYPIVGIAILSTDEAPVEAVLWELLYDVIPILNFFYSSDIDEIDQLNPTNSDLIVPIDSQRNTDGTETHWNFNAGLHFTHTTHSLFPGLGIPGETDSALIHQHVIELLSVFPNQHFNSQWTLGQ